MPPEIEPTEPAPWPPKDWVIHHKVDTSTNWWDVGKDFSFDPWDIIFFNFQTYDFQIVNWYMRTRLNCNLPSPDSLSYRFGRIGDKHFSTYVYIPAKGWKPPSRDDEQAREIVRNTLKLYVSKRIVRMYEHEMFSRHMAAIDMLIGQRIIKIRYRSGGPSSVRFVPLKEGFAEFQVPFLSSTRLRQSYIVREAVYASLALRSATAMLPMLKGLVICVVCQMLFLIKCGQEKPAYLLFATQAIIDVAWKIATEIHTTHKAAFGDMLSLETLISAHPSWR